MSDLRKKLFLFCIVSIIVLNTNLLSQEVPQSVSNTGIYEFLDELANNHIISINSAVKPYSRLFISKRLKEAEEKKDQLNARQQKELDFYLMDFGKEINNEWLNGAKAQTTARPGYGSMAQRNNERMALGNGLICSIIRIQFSL